MRRWLGSLFLLAAVAAAPPVAAAGRQVLVLGFDGMDPNILDDLMARGEMPNFSRLAERGDYSRLQTVTPPQSPVAWAAVTTGMGPGGTGVFDFMHRDPIRMLPKFSGAEPQEAEPVTLFGFTLPAHLTLGSWCLPLQGETMVNTRDGRAFWQILDDHGVPATVLKIPSNFPPVETRSRTLSGMGTPDITGTYGTFQAYTDDPRFPAGNVPGGEIHQVQVQDGRFDAQLGGPENSMKCRTPTVEIPFRVYVDPKRDVVRVDIDDRKILLAKGEWSDWVQLDFKLLPLVESVAGMVRFHLVQAHPHMMLYASPVNLDPTAPALPISTPPELAAEIAGKIGLYYTQGMPEDTQALSAAVLGDDDFMAQARIILEEEDRMLDSALEGFDDGFLFVYYSVIDQVSHMMWRTMDPDHPMWSPELQRRHGDAIPSMYRAADAALGRALSKLGDDATVIVMSDHGFAPFYREVNLNTWLKDQGYLVLTDDALESRTQYFNNIDWGRTRAYAMGFNGLYVNRRGRERWGIVDPGPEADDLLDDLIAKLLTIQDHATGLTAIAQVYRATDIYQGVHVNEAPDLIVGYRRGYRSSDDSALGTLSRPIIQDRLKVWSGDHLMQTDAVPGIIVSNRKLAEGTRRLQDIAPTILSLFGIDPLPEMTGRPLLPPMESR